jgi:hypothetical protein
MNRSLALGIGLFATLVATSALAQDVTIGYQGLPYKSSGESNTGIQVSDGVLLHVGAGAETGYDTNVFYQNSTNAIGSGIVRVMPYAELLNASRTGPVSKQLTFDLRAGLLYRHYLSNDPSVKTYDDAWMPNAGLSLSAGSGQIGFGLADTFARIEEPPYGPYNPAGSMTIVGGPPIIRNNNQASVEGRWSPGGGRLTAVLRYTNMVDVFSNNNYNYANSDTNQLMLDVAWKWLPKTAIFLNATQGYITYFNNTTSKVPSYPLHITGGLRGLLTDKTTAVLTVGYANGFYSSGGSTGGFWGSTFAEATLTVRLTMLSRLMAGYRHDFENAVISSFTYNETVYLSYLQQIAGRLALDLSGRYVHRNYQGIIVDPAQAGRIDNFFQVGASLDYFIRNWVYVGVAYSLLANDATLPGTSPLPEASLNYVKQQMFVRLGVTY